MTQAQVTQGQALVRTTMLNEKDPEPGALSTAGGCHPNGSWDPRGKLAAPLRHLHRHPSEVRQLHFSGTLNGGIPPSSYLETHQANQLHEGGFRSGRLS